MNDYISRQAAIDALHMHLMYRMGTDSNKKRLDDWINGVPSAQTEEVIPHRNYKYFSDYWCECGWHLGKKGEVKYCPDCGRKVNWGE